MTAALLQPIGVATTPSVIGDYTLRAPDYDTLLVGPITDSIIDADRVVRGYWSNGIPNFWLYRAVLAGDNIYTTRLRHWCVAFAVAHCQTGGIRRNAYSEELACVAAWDALYTLIHAQEFGAYSVMAVDLGVDPKTYKRLRDAIYIRLRASLLEYWARLGSAYRLVRIRERRVPSETPRSMLSEGRGFGYDIDLVGDGNFRAYIPKG